MKYLIVMMFIIGFVACILVGCSPYRSKSRPEPLPEKNLVDYNYGDFEDSAELDDHTDVYHVKYVHIIL